MILKLLFKIFVFISLFLTILLSLYTVENYFTSNDKKQAIEEYTEDFYSKVQKDEIEPSKSELKNYFQLTKEEIKSMSVEEKAQIAKKTAVHLAVYDLDLNLKVNQYGEFKCSELKKFAFNDYFSSFKISPKFRDYFQGLDLFGTNYDYIYHSNVYIKDNRDFPLQYRENFKKQVNFYDYKDPFGNSEEILTFEDSLQIVLPGEVNSKIPYDTHLDYLISLDISTDSINENKKIGIPMQIINGKLIINRGEC